MGSVDRKQYWERLFKDPVFWVGLVLVLSYFVLDSFIVATIGLILLVSTKYRIMRKLRD